MNAKLTVFTLSLSLVAILFVGVTAFGTDYRAMEEQGLEIGAESAVTNSGANGTVPMPDLIPEDGVLLIPESSGDVVGMYDPFDGTYLGDLINGSGLFSTPINAIKGPDGNIYVSDQVSDAVFVFDTLGTYLSTYADASDGLDNIRGIDFRNDTLYVTAYGPYVARFAGPHDRLSDFINGAGAFDIHFMEDGRALLGSHASPNGVRFYDVDGTLISQLFDVDFPEQVTYDDLTPGDFLSAAFTTGNRIDDFDVHGTIYQSWSWDYGRGVHRLGNGNLLATSSHSSHSGVYELDGNNGSIVEQENSGTGFRFIELYKADAVSGVDDGVGEPRVFTLGQNYPNPFNARTNIGFSLQSDSRVRVEVYNLMGQKIATLLDSQLPAGSHTVTWDASDVASGVYYYKLSSGENSSVKRMTLLK